MGNAIFPVLPGLKFDNGMAPEFNTNIHRAVSGSEARVGLRAYPLWTFEMSYEVLRAATAYTELQTLVGFFLQRYGSLDSFLYSNPADGAVTAQNFGTMVTGTSAYQLTRSFGGFSEPVHNLNGTPSIYVNGVLTTPASISGTGLVTFSSVTNGAALTWTGAFYYRCRFVEDRANFSQFLKDLWENKKISIVGSTLNKL